MTDCLPLPKKLRRFDVVRARVFYAEHDGRSKERPLAIVSLAVDGDTGIGIKITSKTHHAAGDLSLSGWRDAGFNMPSVARCAQLVRFRVDRLTGYYGRLTAEDIEDIANVLSSLNPSDFLWLSDDN